MRRDLAIQNLMGGAEMKMGSLLRRQKSETGKEDQAGPALTDLSGDLS